MNDADYLGMNVRMTLVLALGLMAVGCDFASRFKNSKGDANTHDAGDQKNAVDKVVGKPEVLRIENISGAAVHLNFKDQTGAIVASIDVPDMGHPSTMDSSDNPQPGITLNLLPGNYDVDGTMVTYSGTLSETSTVSISSGNAAILGVTSGLQIKQIGLPGGDVSRSCNDDSDCLLVNSENHSPLCCASGIDLSQAKWIAVGRFNERYRPFNGACVFMCAGSQQPRYLNDKFSAKCIKNVCEKTPSSGM